MFLVYPGTPVARTLLSLRSSRFPGQPGLETLIGEIKP
jgi:hypothetical protein